MRQISDRRHMKEIQREVEYRHIQKKRAEAREIFGEEDVRDKLVTNAHKRLWKNMEYAYFLLSLGRNPRWIKRLLGLNRTTMKKVFEIYEPNQSTVNV